MEPLRERAEIAARRTRELVDAGRNRPQLHVAALGDVRRHRAPGLLGQLALAGRELGVAAALSALQADGDRLGDDRAAARHHDPANDVGTRR
jgi:hypothetical protein